MASVGGKMNTSEHDHSANFVVTEKNGIKVYIEKADSYIDHKSAKFGPIVTICSIDPEFEPIRFKVRSWKYPKNLTTEDKDIVKHLVAHADRQRGSSWRWPPEVEKIILNDIHEARQYAAYCMRKRWPDLEKLCISDPKSSYFYAKEVIKGRWLEAELTILRDLEVALDYSQWVINSRWPEFEKLLMKNPVMACEYANLVIHCRWREAEPVIKSDPKSAWKYAVNVLKEPWPDWKKYMGWA